MAREKKRKVFVYKRAHFHEAMGSLSRLVAAALDASPTIGQRRECLTPDGETPVWRLIGHFKVEQEFVFGVLMRYMPGHHPACLIDDVTATSVTVEQLALTETEDGKARELVGDMLHFACIDDHVVLMQSGGLKAIHLEHHLLWLMRQTNQIEGTNTISLNDTPTKAVAELLEHKPVRALEIGGDFMPPDEEVSEGGKATARVHQDRRESVVRKDEASAGVLAVLKRLMTQDEASKLDTDALAGSNIGYTLTIRYSHATTDDGQKLMDSLGYALRHADGVAPTIELVGGGRIAGSQLKISGPVSITHYDGVPSSPEVFEEMRKWLLAKVKSGELAA